MKHSKKPSVQAEKNKGNILNKLVFTLGLLLLFGGISGYLISFVNITRFGVLGEDMLTEVPIQDLTEDSLYITQGRRHYQRGQMTLIIPSIQVFTPVGESTLPEGLREMPGLYEFSQLPAQGNVNVSIAGHRDIYDMVFYHLDKLVDGDYLYLLYQDSIYRYTFVEAKIVRPDNWDVIKPQGFSSLTLTTCDPIGTTLNRLVATGSLDNISDYSQEYQFTANQFQA